MVQALKKARNIALDIVLDIACKEGDSIHHIIKWALCILPPEKRLGWLLSIATDYVKDNNEELIGILAKEIPLKISEVNRQKKPLAFSNKNYDNLFKICQYSPSLKSFFEAALRTPKEFELWTSDANADFLPAQFKT